MTGKIAVFVTLAAACCFCQATAPPATAAPAQTAPAPPARMRGTPCLVPFQRRHIDTSKVQTVEALQKVVDEDTECLEDWPYLRRYAEDDQRLVAAGPVKGRVVFMGDSITDGWDLARQFPGKPYVNRGISAETTPQMLVRFYPDVVALKPAAVVILGGTNDLTGTTGPQTVEDIEHNLAAMADIARANGIKVVLASVLPINDYTARKRSDLRPPEKLRAIAEWEKAFCKQTGCTYLDYATPMSDEKGFLKREISDDGLHPNAAGHVIMAPLVERALAGLGLR
jgi:lysophospholipase L1-like esterase